MDAIRNRRRVDHRIARPCSNGIQIEQPTVDDSLQDPVVDALVRCQADGVGGIEPAPERAQPLDFRGDRGGGEILERRVVSVNAVAGRNRRVTAGELIEILVDERCELLAMASLCSSQARDRRRNREEQ